MKRATITMNTFCRALAVALLLSAPAATFAQNSSLQTIDDTLPKIVKIFGAGGIAGLHPYSTGFIIDSSGHVVTLWNHVLDTDEISVVLDNGRRYEARVLGAEPQLDLAVLELEGAEGVEFPHFDLSKAAPAQPGTRVRAFSNMFKVATGDEPVSVLHGVIAARTRLNARRGSFQIPYDGEVYIMDAITNNPGAGGGVVLTRSGTLLGMIGREVRDSRTNTWINYAIPVPALKETIEQIIAGDFVPREKEDEDDNPNRYNPRDFGLVLVPDVVYRTPAYVDAVLPGTLAAKSDLEPDDLVLFVNDELVHSIRSLKSELGRLEAGDTLRLIVRRGNGLVETEMPVRVKD